MSPEYTSRLMSSRKSGLALSRTAPAPPRPAASSGRKPLPPRKPGDCAGVSRAPPPPKPSTFNDDDEHVVQYAAPAPAAYGFKSVNGTGETGAVESNDVDEDEWN